jgi:hypothetical protein
MSIDLEKIHEKSVCLVLLEIKDGEVANASRCLVNAFYDNNTVKLYRQGIEQPVIILEEDRFERIKETPEDLKSILDGADYFIQMTVGNLPDDADTDGMRNTGLKW